MLYVDCKVLGSREFEISWGWPLDNAVAHIPEGQDICTVRATDKTVTHAVIMYMIDGEMKKVPAKTSPYIYKGKFAEPVMNMLGQ